MSTAREFAASAHAVDLISAYYGDDHTAASEAITLWSDRVKDYSIGLHVTFEFRGVEYNYTARYVTTSVKAAKARATREFHLLHTADSTLLSVEQTGDMWEM
jgi:hypothetical protein